MSTDEKPGSWDIGLAEDVDLPGWVWLPEEFEQGQRDAWVDEVVPVILEHIGERQADGRPNSRDEVRALLQLALDERAESGSYAMYQIWPVHAPAAVMCHVNRAATQDVPDLESIEGRVHAAEARHIGPGIQISSQLTVETPDGPTEAAAMHFVFADDEDAIVVHVDPSLPQLVGQAVLGVVLFINALVVTRADGSTFSSVAPTGLVLDEEWNDDADGAT